MLRNFGMFQIFVSENHKVYELPETCHIIPPQEKHSNKSVGRAGHWKKMCNW